MADTSDQPQRPDIPSKPISVNDVMAYLARDECAALLKFQEKPCVPISEHIRGVIDRQLMQTESRK